MAERIAETEVGVGIDDSDLARGLEEAEAKVRKAMADIDKMRSEPEITADLREFSVRAAEIKKEMAEIDKLKADPDVELDDAAFQARLRILRAQLKELSAQKAEVAIEAKDVRDAGRALKVAQRESLGFEKAMMRAAAATEAASQSMRNQGLEVARLRDRYAKFATEAKKLEALEPFKYTSSSRARLAAVRAEMDALSGRLRELGSNVNGLDGEMNEHNHVLTRWASSISNIRVQLGFASLTVRQFGIALTTLGPIIEGLVGAAGALVGSLGAGLAGAAGVASAGLVAMAGGFLGIRTAINPALQDMKSAMDAFKALNDAEVKYGKGSDEAATAQKNLNQTLQNVSPQAATAARGFEAVRSKWYALTEPTRAQFFDTISHGLTTAKSIMPGFAAATNNLAKTLGTGVNQWLDALAGPEMQTALRTLTGNFNQALPSIMRGLQNLGSAFLNVAAMFSNHFASLGSGFESWSEGILAATRNTSSLQSTVSGMIDSMRSWGQLLQSTGRLLTTFFGAGKEAGDGLVVTLSNLFDSWSDWMQTTQGQDSLSNFFEDASSMASLFVSTMAQVIEIFYNITRITAPITTGILEFTRALADLVNGFLGLSGVREILTGIGVAMASVFVVGRVAALASDIKQLALAFGLLKTASTVGAAGGMLTGLEAAGATAATTGSRLGAMRAAALGAGGGLKGVTAAAGAAVAGLNPLGLVAGGLVVTAMYAMGQETDSAAEKLAAFQDTLRERRDYVNTFVQGMHGISDAANTVEQAQLSQKFAQRALNDAIAQYGPKSLEAQQAALSLKTTTQNLTDAQRALKVAVEAAQTAFAQGGRTAKQKMQESEDALSSFIDSVNVSNVTGRSGMTEFLGSTEEQIDGLRQAAKEGVGPLRAYLNELSPSGTLGDLVSDDHLEQLVGKFDELAKAQRAARSEAELGATQFVNLQRATEGLAPMVRGAGSALLQLNKAFGKNLVAKAFVKFDDAGAARKIAQLSAQISKFGGKEEVKSILVNAKGDQEALGALRKLNQATVGDKLVKFKESGGGQVLSILGKILGFKLPTKEQEVKSETRNALSGLARVLGFDLPAKTVRVGADISGALQGLQTVGNALASITDKTVTVTTNYRSTGSPGKYQGGVAVPMPGFAAGGDEAMMKRAQAQAARQAAGKTGTGGRYSTPRYIVGEENRTEYVIATNPSYRKANLRYLTQAAAELGVGIDGYAKGKGGGKNNGGKNNGGKNNGNSGGGGGGGKKGAGGPLTGPQSTYEDIRGQIDNNETAFSNLQRDYQMQLDAGVVNPNPSLGNLQTSKTASIDLTQNLIDHVTDTMLPKLSKQATKHLPKVKAKPKGKPKPPGAKASKKKQQQYNEDLRNYNEKVSAYERSKQRYADAKADRTEAGDTLADFKRTLKDLREEKYGYQLDLRELGQESTSTSDQPSFAEQTASFNSQRYDLYRTMASNLTPIVAAFGSSAVDAMTGGASTGGTDSFAGNPGTAGGSATSAAAGLSAGSPAATREAGDKSSGGGGITVNQTNNYPTPPADPHRFSRSLAFEMQTLGT